MSRRGVERDDGGFTLMELLVAVVIEVLIVGALAMAFTGMLRGSSQVGESLSRSSDARIAAAYIVNDASNSSGPEISLTDTTSCADASPPVVGAQTAVVRFDSTITSSSGATKPDIVIYYLVGTSLVRRECRSGGLTSDSAVASNVASVNVACSPSADCSGTPTSITVTITETATTSGPQYVYSLSGTFQKIIGDGAPGTPSPIITLASGACNTQADGALRLDGNPRLRVYGVSMINGTDNANPSTCSAMEIGTSANEYKAGGTSFLSGGSCHPFGSSQCPPSTSHPTMSVDPYRNLTPPAAASSTCGAGANPTPVGNAYPPGIYQQPLTISSATATFSGDYVFCHGLTLTSAVTVTGTNVLWYFKGGSLDEKQASVTLTAPLSGVVVWQPSGNATTMTFESGGTFQLTGAIYAPSAEIDFFGGSVGTSVTQVVALRVYLKNSANVTVGEPSVPGLSIDPQPNVSWPVGKPFSLTITGTGGDDDYSWSASNLPSPLTMDPGTGIISGTPNATGAKLVTVTLNDALGDDADTATFTLTIDALPTVSSTSPASRGQGAVNQNVVINGTGFVSGAALSSSFSGSGITVNSTTFNSATSVTANISIAAGAATVARDVTVTNGDTGVGTGTGKFIVTAAPTLTSASPASRGQGASQNIVITGTGFVNGVGTLASSFGPGITVNSTTYNSATQVTANITVTAGAATGAHAVTVINGDAGVATGTGAFTVNAGPTVTSATPSSLARGAASQSVVIAGSGFVTGATVSFSGAGITLNNTTFNNANQITATITIAAGATVGSSNITVANPDAGTSVSTGVFTVNSLPTVTSTSPSSEWQGATSQDVVITGTGFQFGAGASFSGTGITVNNTTFNSATSLTANITVTAGATPGVRNVTVLNPDTGSASGTGIFRVGPTVTSINPSSTKKSTSQNVTISGNGFAAGASLSLTCGNTPTITNRIVVNSTTITATFTATNKTTTCDVVVTNLDGGTATLPAGFAVTN